MTEHPRSYRLGPRGAQPTPQSLLDSSPAVRSVESTRRLFLSVPKRKKRKRPFNCELQQQEKEEKKNRRMC